MYKLLVIGVYCCLAGGMLENALAQGADEAAHVDLYGDPLPKGAISRLGTVRFRVGAEYQKHFALSADGSALVVATEAGEIIFWDTATGKRIRELSAEPLNISGFAMSRDGNQLAVAGYRRSEVAGKVEYAAEVRIIDAAMGGASRVFPRELRDVERHPMSFSPDGRFLISLGAEGVVRVEEVETGLELLRQTVPADISPTLALSPDGSTVAVSTGVNTRKHLVWNWAKGEAPREFKAVGVARSFGSLAFSPDGKQLAGTLDSDFHNVQIWDVESGEVVRKMTFEHSMEAAERGIAYSPDGETIIAAGGGRAAPGMVAVHFLNAATGEYEGRLSVTCAAGALAMSADGRMLAAASGVGVKLWKWPSREEVLPVEEAHSLGVNAVATADDGIVATGSDDGSVRLWDPASGRQRAVMRHGNWVRAIALSPDGSKLASSSLDDTVRLWDCAGGREIYKWPGHGRLGGSRLVAFSADGLRVIVHGDDLLCRVWDVADGKALHENRLPPADEEPGDKGPDPISPKRFERAAVSPDGSLLAFAAQERQHLYHSHTGEPLGQLGAVGSRFTSLVISPDNALLLTCAWNRPRDIKLPDGSVQPTTEATVTLWDLKHGKLLEELSFPKSSVDAIAFSESSRQFVVAVYRPKRRIAVYDALTAAELQAFDAMPSRVRSLCFGRDGKTLVSGMADSTAIVWRLK